MHHLVKCHSFLFRSRSASTQPHHIDRLQCSSYYFKREDCFKLPGVGQVKRPPSRYQARSTVQVRSPVSRSHARTSHSCQHNFTLYVGNITRLFLRYRTECWFQHDFHAVCTTNVTRSLQCYHTYSWFEGLFDAITPGISYLAWQKPQQQQYHTGRDKVGGNHPRLLIMTKRPIRVLTRSQVVGEFGSPLETQK